MAVWYRVHTSDNPLQVFSGEGGLFVAGRWNHRGQKVVYCSESIALATIEWLSHNGLSVSGFNYYRYSIEIPDSVIRGYDADSLPEDWRATPATESTRDFAHKALFTPGNPLAISVASVFVPEERNLIINPLHPDFAKVSGSIANLGEYRAPVRQD